jgi:hypothetical protein
MGRGRARDRRSGSLGRLALLATAGLGVAAVAVERALARVPADELPLADPVRASVEIEAPIDRIWPILVDIPGQLRWMPEMREVTIVTPGPLAEGSAAEATVRIFGIAVRDRVVITRFQPPVAFGIEHQSLFRGRGLIELRPGGDGTTTTVEWTERLIPPLLPTLGWILQRPVIARLYQRDLFLLRDIVLREVVDQGEQVGHGQPDAQVAQSDRQAS